MIATRRARQRLAIDVGMLALAACVETLSAQASGVDANPVWRVVFAMFVLALLVLRGFYRPTTAGRHFLDDARTIVSATALATMMITFARVLFADQTEVAEEAIRFWLFAVVYLIAGTAVLAILTERINRTRGGIPTVILGAGRVGHLVARRLTAHPELGLRPIGFVDANPLNVEGASDLPVWGADDRLEPIIAENRVEHAIIAFFAAPHDAQLELARKLQRMGVSVSIVPRLFEGMPDRIVLDRLGGLPLVTLYPSNPTEWRISVKYALDRVFALLAIVTASPLLLFGAIGTAVSLGPPILFRQRRVGLDGREFEMLKFRTMRPGPEPDTADIARQAARDLAPGGTEGADRVSRFGALLRRTNLDELPQLFNVLAGEMSFVGPRPERSSYVGMFQDAIRRYDDRHQVKAGITGWAQVHGLRGETSLADRIEWDNYYIENWSPWLDLKILLLTALTILRRPAESP